MGAHDGPNAGLGLSGAGLGTPRRGRCGPSPRCRRLVGRLAQPYPSPSYQNERSRLSITTAGRETNTNLFGDYTHAAKNRTSDAITAVAADDRATAQVNWLSAVASLAQNVRPDLAASVSAYLGVEPSGNNPLADLSIGELGVVYEAILALSDHHSRKAEGQYFTPDDVAEFMAAHLASYEPGVWIDPCCGVGNLAWHLIANSDEDARGEFLRGRLILVDRDPVALRTAVALLCLTFADLGDEDAVAALAEHSIVSDFLRDTPLPPYDFAIFNPPYARSSDYDSYRTAATRDLYALFMEKISATTAGFISITPSSYLSGTKYAPVRQVLKELNGGRVYVFDNVPDTCFRGFKYGSSNTSKTNFVRAAITVVSPKDKRWLITPILRWASRSRSKTFKNAWRWLTPLKVSPDGTWAKLMPGFEDLWDVAVSAPKLRELTQHHPSPWRLEVASTPRYYISASTRDLDRSSKHVLFFTSEEARDRGYLALNSSMAYWWWRTTDGGISLSKRTLLSVPVLTAPGEAPAHLMEKLRQSDIADVVVKLNSGRLNENVKRSRELIAEVDRAVFGENHPDFSSVYAADMFAETEGSNLVH